MPNLEEIRRLSPAALDIFKKQAYERARAGDQDYARLVGSPEYQSMFQEPNLLERATAPFRWISENITEPFSAAVHSPFTPSIKGTENLPWMQRELAEYKGWENEPKVRIPGTEWDIGTKGIVESLPWLAVPSAGAVAGKLGGIAAKGGAIGKAAQVGAAALKPVAAVEAIPGKVIGKAAEAVFPKQLSGKTAPKLLSEGEKEAGKPIITPPPASKELMITPPPKPPIPPIPTKPNEADDYMRMFGEAITSKQGETKWDAIQVLRERTRADRGQSFLKVLGEQINSGKSPNVAYDEAVKLFGGKLEKGESTLGELIPSSVRPAFEAKIQEALAGNPYEIAATTKAFRNALTNDAIPRVRGIAGSSAYDRLAKVFGSDFVNGIEEAVKALPAKQYPPLDPAIMDYLRSLPTRATKSTLLPEEALSQPIARETLLGAEKPTTLQPVFKSAAERAQETLELKMDLLANPQKISQMAFPENDAAKVLSMFPESQRVRIVDQLRKMGVNLVDALNIPRSLQSAYDLSMPFRQGIIALGRYPKEWVGAWKPMMQALKSEEIALKLEKEILSDVDVMRAVSNGWLDLPTVAVNAPYMKRLESFASNFAEKIPGVRMSQRAATVFVEKLQSDIWKSGAKQLQKIGADETHYRLFGQMVNEIVGRGEIPQSLQKYAVAFNLLYSPRLLSSRVLLPTRLFSSSAFVRKEAWKTAAAFLGYGSTILGLYKVAGGKLEADPRSADFGKMVVGNTRLDIWGGYTQYGRLLARLGTQQTKTAAGNIRKQSYEETLSSFLRSKESPAVGIVSDLISGQMYGGQKVTAGTMLYQTLVPLAAQDLIDAAADDGLGGALVASPGIVGVGVTTYTGDVQQEQNKLAKAKYGLSWEDVGRTYGRKAQLELEQTSPTLKEAIKRQEESYVGKSVAQTYRSEQESIEELYRTIIERATREFRATGNGLVFRAKVDEATKYRRNAYAAMQGRKEYADIVSYQNQPLSPEQAARMNPSDIIRRQYNQVMYSPEMFDEFGNYNYDKAELVENQFIAQYGQRAMDYIEEYNASKWLDKPPELQALQQSRQILEPYWQVSDQMWSQFPPELKQIAGQIAIAEQSDPATAKRMLFMYPQIVWIRKQIALMRRQIKMNNPEIAQALNTFY